MMWEERNGEVKLKKKKSVQSLLEWINTDEKKITKRNEDYNYYCCYYYKDEILIKSISLKMINERLIWWQNFKF